MVLEGEHRWIEVVACAEALAIILTLMLLQSAGLLPSYPEPPEIPIENLENLPPLARAFVRTGIRVYTIIEYELLPLLTAAAYLIVIPALVAATILLLLTARQRRGRASR